MQYRLLTLLFVFSLVTHFAQPAVAVTEDVARRDLQIPVELVKGIKSDKAKPGDPIQLRMAEAILANNGLVIPANARLYGHVLQVAVTPEKHRTVLSMVVDRAEWRGHVLPLNAYVVGWGQRRMVQPESVDCRPTDPLTNRFAAAPLDLSRPGGFDTFDCMERPHSFEAMQSNVTSNIHIFRDRTDRSTVLVSPKKIHLPGGTLMMLQNIGEPVSLSAQ